MRSGLGVAGFVLIVSLSGVAAAQTGPGLMLQPWDEPTATQVDADVHLFGSADVRGTNRSVRMRRFALEGRYRPDPEPERDEIRVGYDILHWHLSGGDRRLPNRLTDASVAGAWIRPLDQGRRIGVVGGIGYAGDRLFGDRDAVYFMGDLIFQQPLDERSIVTLSLNYDGNRTLWPDVPLPLIAYSRQVSDELSYTVGLPSSTVRWQPTEHWVLSASYSPVFSFDARAEFLIDESWRLFAAFENEYRGFVDDEPERRLFLQQRRLEAGIHYRPHHQWHVLFAGGHAFGQRFERGWDARSTETVRRVSSAPYLRAAIGFEF